MSVAKNLAAAGIKLPAAPAPVANYLPYIISGNLIFVSGQLSKNDLNFFTDKVGESPISVDKGKMAAEASILNVIAQVNAALNGDLDRVKRVVKINIHVNSTPLFTQQAAIGNAASNLLVKVFGDKGRHARCALGAGQLPLNATTEIDAIVEFEPKSKL